MLEDLKAILKDDSLHLFMGQVERLHIADDRSYLKAEVNVWPEERTIIADVAWDSVGPESGFYAFPAVGDAVLCCSAEGDVDQSFIIKRLSSKEDQIPKTALEGDSVIRALKEKKLWLTSDTRINLSVGDEEPEENVVLGQIFKQFASDFIDKVVDMCDALIAETHVGNAGYATSPPINVADYEAAKAALQALKASPIQDEVILSDLSFTEKGD